MRQNPGNKTSHSEKMVKDIHRATRKQYSAKEKIRIVLNGLKGEDSIAELCRHEDISQNLIPADVYFGRGQTILEQRERIRRKTIEARRLLNRKSAA